MRADPPRPVRLTVELCLLCGSTSPAVPAPDCAHGRVARLAALPEDVSNLVVRIRRARHGITAALATLGEIVELERLAGRARVTDAAPVYDPGDNVVFLRPRDTYANDDGSPAVPPPQASPRAPQRLASRPPLTAPAAPSWSLSAPEPSRRRKRSGPSPSGSQVAPLQASPPTSPPSPALGLFDPPPSTGRRL